jgi:hypothetical protein
MVTIENLYVNTGWSESMNTTGHRKGAKVYSDLKTVLFRNFACLTINWSKYVHKKIMYWKINYTFVFM